MNKASLFAVFVATLGIVHSAMAEDWSVENHQWFISPMIGVSFEDKDRLADEGMAVSLGLGKQIADKWALELSLFGEKHNGYNDFLPYGIGVDFLRKIGGSGLTTPYFILGTGYMKADIIESPSISQELDYDNLIGTAGIGVISPLGDFAGRFRGEVRYRQDFHDPSFNDLLVMAGLYFPLGAADSGVSRQNAMLPDSDNDGVPDDIDLCPGTAAGSQIDRYGCELDKDGDGVGDSKDRCPDTPRGTTVDSSGCEKSVDSDSDGVADKDDRCPGTPRSARVGADGCELDDDSDGVVNSLDSCKNTAAGVRVDARGCEIRGKIELPGVRFGINSATLIPESTAILDQAAATLRQNPDLQVEAAGYTDSSGAASLNLDLSQRRAESVRQYLISKGANGDNIAAKGYGEANPIADNSTGTGRQKNRRVDLRVLN